MNTGASGRSSFASLKKSFIVASFGRGRGGKARSGKAVVGQPRGFLVMIPAPAVSYLSHCQINIARKRRWPLTRITYRLYYIL